MRRYRASDEGSTHVLEAVIIATIMLSAVAFVATFESPTPAPSPTRNLLRQQADDALALLMSEPVKGSSLGDNLLSVLLAKCLQGSCTDLTTKLDHLLPQGASYALYVSNGYDTFPVYVTRGPPGEAITAKRLLEPKWSTTFTSPATTNVNNATDPMLVYALPALDSNVISPGGSPLKVTVWGKKRTDQSDFILQSYYTTESHATTDANQVSAVSMNFLVNRTDAGPVSPPKPGAYWNATAFTMMNGFPTNASLPVTIELKESAGTPIPAGTQLTVHVPRAWNASSVTNAQWNVTQAATDWNNTRGASDVVATLLSPIVASSAQFTFNATYHGDLLNYYTFNAILSNGADAEANVIVKADTWPAYTQTFAAPSVVASVPRPMGVSDTTAWSLAVAVPYDSALSAATAKDGLQGYVVPAPDPKNTRISPNYHAPPTTPEAEAIDVTRINITELNGAPIFGSVLPADFAEGTWTTNGVSLSWNGSHDMHVGPLSLSFTVAGHGVAGDLSARKPIVPPVTFDTYSGRLVDQISPGFFRSVVLPDNSTAALYQGQPGMVQYHGYNAYSPNSVTSLQHNYTSSPLYRGVVLGGSATYTLNPTLPFEDSLYGSYANVNQRTVPIGGDVIVTADVQSVLYSLSAAGIPAGVTLTFYPPWTGDQHVPIWTQPNLDSALGTSGVAGMVMLDVNGDGNPDPVVGTSNGRVFALDALTGTRIQGTAWVAPLKGGATTSTAAITAMTTITSRGQQYVVVGLDSSSNLYVLDKSLNTFASFTTPPSTSVYALDATTDLSTPADGVPDIVAYLSDGSVYVLSMPASAGPLTPIPTPGSLNNMFSKQVAAGPLATEAATGIDGRPGVALGYVNNGGAVVTYDVNAADPLNPSITPHQSITFPSAGIQMVDTTGRPAWSLGGLSPTVLRAYDRDHDATGDLLVGGSNGYVYALNGKKGGSPATGLRWVPASSAVDADMHDASHGAFVTDDGGIYYTMDGWDKFLCVNCDPLTGYSNVDARLNGIAMNGIGSLWAVGNGGVVYKSGNTQVAGQPRMTLVTISATDQNLPVDLTVNVHDYKDVQFEWETNHGWIVGSPLLGTCSLPTALASECNEAIILHTNDGATWTRQTFENLAVDAKVTTTLTRINFTDPAHGWILGQSGTLLRTQDSGFTWMRVPTGTTNDLYDISCSPADRNVCLLVGANGYLQKITNATTGTPTWTNLSANINSDGVNLSGGAMPRPLYSVSMADNANAYVGATSNLWRTSNAGANWTAVPVNGADANNITRLVAFPDSIGFGFGGNASTEMTYHFATFLGASSARTKDVTLNTLDPLAVVDSVDVTALVGKSSMGQTDANFSVSADGGTTWTQGTNMGDTQVSFTDNGVGIIAPITTYHVDVLSTRTGRTVLVKVDFWNAPDLSYQTARVASMAAKVTYHVGTGPQVTQTFPITLTDPATYKDTSSATNATWDANSGELRNPAIPQFWVSNVSGQVKDIQAPFNAVGDALPDVWVGTGSVLASNSADYKSFIGSNGDPNTLVRADNRVYLLDGNNGTIVSISAPLPGPVHALRVQDVNGDNVPDYVFVAYDANATGLAGVRALYAWNLTPVPISPTLNWDLASSSGITGLEPGMIGPRASVYYGTNVTKSGGFTGSGTVFSYNATLEQRAWGVPTDVHGAYVVKKTIPTNWLFGPYVIQISVDWTETSMDAQTGATHSVAQSARYFDYFMVTPPKALTALPSPIYDVHLVAWMDDWR